MQITVPVSVPKNLRPIEQSALTSITLLTATNNPPLPPIVDLDPNSHIFTTQKYRSWSFPPDGEMPPKVTEIIKRMVNSKDDKDQETSDAQVLVDFIQSLQMGYQSLETDVRCLRTDVQSLRTDVKTDVQSLRTDAKSLKTDVQSLRTDAKSLKTDVQNLRTDAKSLKIDVQHIGEVSVRGEEERRIMYYGVCTIILLYDYTL